MRERKPTLRTVAAEWGGSGAVKVVWNATIQDESLYARALTPCPKLYSLPIPSPHTRAKRHRSLGALANAPHALALDVQMRAQRVEDGAGGGRLEAVAVERLVAQQKAEHARAEALVIRANRCARLGTHAQHTRHSFNAA
eukprot:6214741-Pleurochrysis_carterae.AAC.10